MSIFRVEEIHIDFPNPSHSQDVASITTFTKTHQDPPGAQHCSIMVKSSRWTRVKILVASSWLSETPNSLGLSFLNFKTGEITEAASQGYLHG